MFGRGAGLRPLRPSAVEGALRAATADPLTNALPGSRLQEIRRSASALGREFAVSGPDRRPTGLLWDGVNAAPVVGERAELDRFAERLAARQRRASSLVGPRDAVERMWGRLERSWDAPRELRWSQPLLEAVDDPAVVPDARLRLARVGEEGIVAPAAIAMFREEVGLDPTAHDGGAGYRRRVAELVAAGRTYVIVEEGEVLFKADVGALFAGVAQLHGVWVPPDRRGEGIARAAMAAVVEQVRREHAQRVSLYVNDFNEPARRAYAAAGFRQAGELTTILF